MTSPLRCRPVRAGAVAFVYVSALWLGLVGYFDADRCRSTQLTPFPCLGEELIATAVGLVLGIVVIAWGLAGKGPAHSLLGAFACGVGGLKFGFWVSDGFLTSSNEVAAIIVIAALISTLTALWAWTVPALTSLRHRSTSRL